MQRTLIVARLDTEGPGRIADIFGESDASELPGLIGVSRRTLFQFHGLYFHLAEADENITDITPSLYRARSHPLYQDIHDKLAQHLKPYDPAWAEPKDAMAQPFYTWTAKDGRTL